MVTTPWPLIQRQGGQVEPRGERGPNNGGPGSEVEVHQVDFSRARRPYCDAKEAVVIVVAVIVGVGVVVGVTEEDQFRRRSKARGVVGLFVYV